MTLNLTNLLDWAAILFTTFVIGTHVQLAIYYGQIWSSLFSIWVFWELFNIYLAWRLNRL
jgi:hypothetical protein